MTRVGAPNNALAFSAAAETARNRASTKRHKPYKVVLEHVTQEKKKLRQVISFNVTPPRGYTFVASGNPEVTQACKDLSHQGNHQIFIVSTAYNKHKEISAHVHRVGYHFASTVVNKVCDDLHYSFDRRGRFRRNSVHDSNNIGSSNAEESSRFPSSSKSQDQINDEARVAIKDLFPNIPFADLQQIVQKSFKLGGKKVGTAFDRPLNVRAALAVVAHIRHVYTDYDDLLRSGPYLEARAAVEKVCLAKMFHWKGEDDSRPPELEQILREVIVISDDSSDSDSEVEDHDRESSVEMISSEQFAQNVQYKFLEPDQILYDAEDESHASLDPSRKLTIQAPQERKRKTRRRRSKAVDRRGFDRYQAVLDQYKNDPDFQVAQERAAKLPPRTLDSFSISKTNQGSFNDRSPDQISSHITVQPRLSVQRSMDQLHLSDGFSVSPSLLTLTGTVETSRPDYRHSSLIWRTEDKQTGKPPAHIPRLESSYEHRPVEPVDQETLRSRRGLRQVSINTYSEIPGQPKRLIHTNSETQSRVVSPQKDDIEYGPSERRSDIQGPVLYHGLHHFVDRSDGVRHTQSSRMPPLRYPLASPPLGRPPPIPVPRREMVSIRREVAKTNSSEGQVIWMPVKRRRAISPSVASDATILHGTTSTIQRQDVSTSDNCRELRSFSYRDPSLPPCPSNSRLSSVDYVARTRQEDFEAPLANAIYEPRRCHPDEIGRQRLSSDWVPSGSRLPREVAPLSRSELLVPSEQPWNRDDVSAPNFVHPLPRRPDENIRDRNPMIPRRSSAPITAGSQFEPPQFDQGVPSRPQRYAYSGHLEDSWQAPSSLYRASRPIFVDPRSRYGSSRLDGPLVPHGIPANPGLNHPGVPAQAGQQAPEHCTRFPQLN